ncbi:hypothetical protein SKAU_G00316090 [Synaphobranchus kaupii]|uniref:Uncharacterized protein n=1 Tax=Synaphobranchus kaupii TaxID=118154 RepID=A0A9Q1ESL3_SYNKA|nr:hypothetical protein SKAU_G00316090 [Synaphobranchus kaupii]
MSQHAKGPRLKDDQARRSVTAGLAYPLRRPGGRPSEILETAGLQGGDSVHAGAPRFAAFEKARFGPEFPKPPPEAVQEKSHFFCKRKLCLTCYKLTPADTQWRRSRPVAEPFARVPFDRRETGAWVFGVLKRCSVSKCFDCSGHSVNMQSDTPHIWSGGTLRADQLKPLGGSLIQSDGRALPLWRSATGWASPRSEDLFVAAAERPHGDSQTLHFIWPEGSHDSCKPMARGLSRLSFDTDSL